MGEVDRQNIVIVGSIFIENINTDILMRIIMFYDVSLALVNNSRVQLMIKIVEWRIN